jgi:uncharacterized protein YjiS (DUF1127 family)
MKWSIVVGHSRAITQSLPPRSALLKLVLRGVLANLKKRRRTRRAERELLALDDRLLRDIGLCRAEIPHAVRGERQRIYELAADQQL